ncbi:MAG: hypothetical protein Q3994_00385 [Prevotella sp.]|nr:hypothetical protein [Prevotella sp.]
MQKIKGYLLAVFLIENLMVQAPILHGIANIFFYIFLSIGFLCAFDPKNWSRESKAKFGWIFSLMMIYIIYEFIVGREFITQQTFLYLIAKISTFFIIMTSLNYHFDFYESRIMLYLLGIIALITLYGILSGGTANMNDARVKLGFSNPNSTGAFGAIISGIILFYSKSHKLDWKCFLILFIGVFAILASGSRAAVLMLFILIIFRYGVGYKVVVAGLCFLLFAVVILPNLGLETVGVDRLLNTINGVEGVGRDKQREAAIWMIQQRPWTGWGFNVQNQGYALQLTLMGSHNGYLETFKYMGLPIGIIWFLIIVIATIKYWRSKVIYHIEMDFYFTILIALYVKSMYEGLFTGVHEFETNLFFVALAILSSRNYYLKYDKDYTVNTGMG